MRKLILSLMLVAGAFALVGCSEDIDDDYEEYEYEGNEKIEIDTDDEREDRRYDRDEEYDD